MTSPEVDLSDQDRNSSIAKKSGQIHNRNNIDRVRAAGIEVKDIGGIALVSFESLVRFLDDQEAKERKKLEQ
ncbi:MAG: hypothetical protein JWN75_284 [Candidatus Saccharibacteria bacterium]|nr:hypothetical protein [Candidatus Saccharibacteria bacterium]